MADLPTLDNALQDLESEWRSRSNTRAKILTKAPDLLCQIVERDSPDKSDVCLYCPLSIYNDDMGCPDVFQRYKEAKTARDAMMIAEEAVEFVACVRAVISGG
ncbi:MAG: hypothetical protein M0P29_12755 [Sphaerochaetaceae bacterium]|jgi:5'(3')-deoxyribonucleotidase|nr:hypothetical protein [Sphaerochaetaceae bacterium]